MVFIWNARSRAFPTRTTVWLTLAALAGGIVGAKVVRLLFATTAGGNLNALSAHPDGRTIIGGILGGWLCVELAKMRLGEKRSTGDSFALALPLAESIGRLGCFFNGCCYGAVSSLPWAVFQEGEWRHPAQLYSMAVSLIIFAIILFLRSRPHREGDLFRIYLVLWGLSRFCLEFLRERTEIHFGLSLAQWVCLEVATCTGIAVIVMRVVLQKKAGTYE